MIHGYRGGGRGRAAGHRIRSLLMVAGLLTAVLTSTRDSHGQFISPGKLAKSHANDAHLNGITNCTKCHELRSPGAARDKCLECHVPMRNRLNERLGLHSTFEEEDCGACHKDHFGADFDMVRFDTASFEHNEKTDYELVDSHAEAECRSCHKADLVEAEDVRDFKGEHGALDRTWLGLGTTCNGCHSPETPHEGQFGDSSCDECHAVTTWEEAASFDHDQSRFRLLGKHRDVACEDCHKPLRNAQREKYVQYVQMEFDLCQDCHEDEHEGKRGNDCTECHVNSGWHRIRRETFEEGWDHSLTEFELVGHHAEAECSTCHGKPPKRDEEIDVRFVVTTLDFTYPRPVAEDCVSCHRDYHRGVFEDSLGGIVCDDCHSEHDWLPVDYDVERHNEQSPFALEGAHVTTPCNLCHPEPDDGQEAAQFTIEKQDCVSCHAEDEPHQDQFTDRPCEDCHDSRAFLIPDYDHSQTEFPLDGKHQDVPCASCHPEESDAGGDPVVRYKPLDYECRDCHRGD